MKTLLLFIFITFLSACSASKKQLAKQEEKCLDYEPQKVQLEGQLFRKSFAGPPNYMDVKKGDEEEIYWLIKTTKPFCVNGNDQEFGNKVLDQSEVQLVMSSAFDFYKTKRSLLGQKVTVQGNLFPQMTGHHKTEVLITVESLEKAHE